ncbi:hypothetical protein SAMN04488118_11478 [Epibacterium ulvae]|uniref:Lipoprotein n=1 Tax=Epibacterium ulvae TaxID=1156985 RepID=A0A1G5RF55_9RHOB|nr:hypothetical protein [Epibacterium ulvae]SCZ72518.1 hypothetical protein SAMN04488118_11478 [Epibacterium ulvae]
MFKRLLSTCIVFGMAATAPPAWAMNCADRSVVIERLQSKFSETLTVGGLQNNRQASSLVEIWSSGETGTFTILVTRPNGISCVVAAGTDFFEALPDTTPIGTPS